MFDNRRTNPDKPIDNFVQQYNSKDVDRIVNQRIGDAEGKSARAIYQTKFMNDLPPTYRELLPITTDQDKLSAAEQSIREQYRNELRVHGPIMAKLMGWTPPAGTLEGDAALQQRRVTDPPINMANMSANDLIKMGLSLSSPSRQRK